MIPGHDRLCPVVATDLPQCPQCALIAKVRADERERQADKNAPVVIRLMKVAIETYRADLRAKVEAMDHDSRCGENKPADADWRTYCDCFHSELLAWIDGGDK